jgi:ankyrin repeat protein
MKFSALQRSGSPLHLSAKRGHLEAVRTLLDRGANTEAVIAAIWDGYSHRTPLHCAAEEGHADVVRLLLDRSANIGAPMSVSESAVIEGNEMKVTYDECLTNQSGMNSLHRAAMRGHLEVVRLLLDRGVDIHIKNIVCRNFKMH